MKKIAILGSTGSIGTQALDIVRKNRDRFQVSVLTCAKSVEKLREQIREFQPQVVVTEGEEDAKSLQNEFPGLEVLHGMEGLINAASQADSHMVLNALVGMRGLMPTYHAIKAGKDIALANKETLVSGGSVIMEAVLAQGVELIPVDSEHSAVFQCMEGNSKQDIKRIILTASGGPFRGFAKAELENVTKEQALRHPKWKMGNKITIDSATLMNKGLEVIEARWLFDIPGSKIDVVVHPQSIIHSMVEYKDNSILAQLGIPDMRIPISLAFTYPKRLANDMQAVDFTALGQMTFEKPDFDTFECLKMAYEALKTGGSAPVILNAANEILVELFLEGKIKFIDIQRNLHTILEKTKIQYNLGISDILEIDGEIRKRVIQEWS